MKLKFKEIRNTENYVKSLHDFLCLYTTAFPSEERRMDWTDVEIVSSFIDKKDEFNIIVVTIENRFVGFLSYWNFEKYIYVEHFAVNEQDRGKGIGKDILCHVIDNICGNIILEVELPNNEIARRRVDFYIKERFKLWQNIEYIQPAYSKSQTPVSLLLMTKGDVWLCSNEDEKIVEIKSKVYQQNLL